MNFNREFIFFLFFISTISLSCHNNKTEKKDELPTINSSVKIGEKFNLTGLIDTNKKPFLIDYSKSHSTLIDFWINDCPPCIEEMTQFGNLVKERDTEIQIISISLSSYSFWKKLFIDKSERYSFLKQPFNNWKHLNLTSQDNESLNNPFLMDRLAELKSKFNVTFFPTYFVLDSNGIIKDRPLNAVEYIKKLMN